MHLRGAVTATTSRPGTLERVLLARLTCRGQRPATATESRCTSGYRLVGLVESFQGMSWRPMGANGEPRGGVASAALARKRVRHASQVVGLTLSGCLSNSNSARYLVGVSAENEPNRAVLPCILRPCGSVIGSYTALRLAKNVLISSLLVGVDPLGASKTSSNAVLRLDYTFGTGVACTSSGPWSPGRAPPPTTMPDSQP